MADFLDAFLADVKQAAKQRRSDEILDYMRANWKYFAPSKKRFDIIWEELYRQEDLSVTSLSEALGLDERILFRRTSLQDISSLFLHPLKSTLRKKFMELVDTTPVRDACLIFVSGTRTAVLTNMDTVEEPGLVWITIPTGNGHTAQLFRMEDAPKRLPRLFTHEEI